MVAARKRGAKSRKSGGDGDGDGGEPVPLLTNGPEKCPDKSVTTSNVKEVFMTLYGALMITMVIAFTFLFLSSFADVVGYGYREISQALQLSTDKRVFINETNDYGILQYPVSTVEDEPYNVYMQQRVVTFIIQILAFFFIVIGAQLFMHFLLSILNVAHQIDYTESSGFEDTKFLVISAGVGVVIVGIVALTAFYNNFFLKKIEPDMLHIRAYMQQIRAHFITHTPALGDSFWAALKAGRNEAIIQEMATALAQVGKNDAPTDRAAKKAISMLYACNLYNALVNTIPESDPMWFRLDALFSSDSRKAENDINMLFYYNNIPIINNDAYSALKALGLDKVYKGVVPLDTLEKQLKLSNLEAIDGLNTLLNGMRGIRKSKQQFFSYIIGFFAIALLGILFLIFTGRYAVKKFGVPSTITLMIQNATAAAAKATETPAVLDK